MRFMTIYRPGRDSGAPPSEEHVALVGQMIQDWAAKGVLLATDGLLPSSKGAKVRISNGKFTVTDGPFAEAKEVIGGYAIINAKSKEEAIELTKTFLQAMGEGESEIREMYEQPAFPPESSDRPGKAKESQRAVAAKR